MSKSTLTERGQISVPAALRKTMGLRTGQQFRWERVADRELRLIVESDTPASPMSVLGYARKLRPAKPQTTQAWMRELREGEANS
jgi:AbrB family looped-hinge helix DNA binding protein